jgi:hypothetical protein
VGVNDNPLHNTIDWGFNKRLLVAMKNEVYHLNMDDPKGYKCIKICRQQFIVTAVKWVLSTTYHSNDPEKHDSQKSKF